MNLKIFSSLFIVVSSQSAASSSSSVIPVPSNGNGGNNGNSTLQVLPPTSSPPQQCLNECRPFTSSLQGCKQTITPASQKDWQSTCSSLSTCICPLLDSNPNCLSCMVSKPSTVGASTYWTQLQSYCTQNTAAVQICALFNVTISANIIGAVNSTSTTLLPPPAPATTTKKSAGFTISAVHALFVALIASVLLI